ncbi:DUF4142 domain-containing protein [Roseisolibacter agri]|uniref:DUF4142 domain-containing protein n=1 Tax=Roseisolibacter agri TaxID=2014610 RepID=A0AA37QDW7_9BACT|nr:DUF4142 domain-containing protein [Roseisolibacter agri]GLC23963.1 hypothetical protein rosag_04760 [Roseisolibacter agri]
MRQVIRWGSTALLASLAATGCGGNDRGDTASQGDTAAAAGEVSPGATTDSGAMVGAPAAGDMSSMSAPDMMALIGASNAAEIRSSQSAVEKATNRDVRAFARRMVDEHQAMQKQADELAVRINVTPGNPAPAVEKTRMSNEMSQQLSATAKGEAFDRQYMDGQVQAHQQTLAELQAMQNTSNADLRTLIQGAIPKVQAHLQDAQQLQGRLGGTAGATGTTTPGTSTPGATSGATSGATTGATGTTGTTPPAGRP